MQINAFVPSLKMICGVAPSRIISSDGKYFYIGSSARDVQRRSLEGQNIYTLSYPSSVQNPTDIVSSNDAGDKYKIEFITTDGGTNVFKTGHNKYIDN